MTLSPMEPNVSDKCCHELESIRVYFCEADRRSVGNCSQPSHAKYSAEVVKEVNGQKSPWRTREIMRVIDSKQYSTVVIS
jgi:hypothetical protein